MINIQKKNHDKYMLWATLPLILCGSVLYGPRVLLLCGIAIATAKAVDVLVSMLRKEPYESSDHSSELSAIIFCLMLPVNIPVYVVVVSVFLAVIVGKHCFGGKDVYPFNLAALAMCCAAVNWQDKVFVAVTPFSKVNFWTGYTTGATITTAGIVKNGGVPTYGTLDLLLGNHPGAMGSDFVIVIIAIGIYLIATKKITWHIPVSFLLTCVAIAAAFPRVYGFPVLESLQLELLNGVVLYTALFMLNEPTTTPGNPKAKILYGVLAGVLGMIFRYFGGFELGTCFALILVNTMDGVIDRFAENNFSVKAMLAATEKAIKDKAIKEKTEKAEKTTDKHTYRAQQPKEKTQFKPVGKAGQTFDIIGEAEDSIDEVIYSTRTLSIEEILKAEEEMKRRKGEK